MKFANIHEISWQINFVVRLHNFTADLCELWQAKTTKKTIDKGAQL